MSAAAYNRGTRLIRRAADEAAASAGRRMAVDAVAGEVQRLREQVASLTKMVARARRCLAAERAGRDALRARLVASEREYAFVMACLLPMAFGTQPAKEVGP